MDPQTIPTHLTHSSQSLELARLDEAVRQLHQQVALLAVWEWLQQHPDFSTPLVVSLCPDTEIFEAKTQPPIAATNKEPMRKLVSRLDDIHTTENSKTLLRLITRLNQAGWQHEPAQEILCEEANDRTKIGEALFVHAAQARLDQDTTPAVGTTPRPRI